jgi:hypothetical protein
MKAWMAASMAKSFVAITHIGQATNLLEKTLLQNIYHCANCRTHGPDPGDVKVTSRVRHRQKFNIPFADSLRDPIHRFIAPV